MRRMTQAALAAAALAMAAPSASAETTIKVGFCARTVSSAVAPFAIASKMGWFAERGLAVRVVPLPGSTDCVKEVATGDLPYALPSVEPLAMIRPEGVKAKIFYTAYQGYNYGIAVPSGSAVKSVTDLKGKKIGVTSMASAGVIVARAMVAAAGLDPDHDVQIVVAGEAAQTAALLRSQQVDALSQFDVQYVLVENAGVALRWLDRSALRHYPSNGFLALEKTLVEQPAQAIALARGYAMGTVFLFANPEAAIRILYEEYPQSKPTGKDEATAIRDDIKALAARQEDWRLSAGGVARWGESNVRNYADYIDFLLKWGVIKEKVPVDDLVTNEFIGEINKFDAAKVAAAAKAYKM